MYHHPMITFSHIRQAEVKIYEIFEYRRGKNVRACCVLDQTLVCFSGSFHPLLLRFIIYFRKSRAHICNDRGVITLKVTKGP